MAGGGRDSSADISKAIPLMAQASYLKCSFFIQ